MKILSTFCKNKHKIKQYNSIQIWHEFKTKSSPTTNDENICIPISEIDVNIWRLKKKWLGRHNYLDIGLKIINGQSIQKVYMYFPFIITETEISDLGFQLRNQEVLNGIFNENYSADNNNKLTTIKQGNTTVFTVYELQSSPQGRDIALSHEYGGTVISFEVKSKNNDKMYYRFRIASKNFGNFFEIFKPKNSFFESAFAETEIVDFRMNEKRNQDLSLMEKISENRSLDISKINFFVISPMKDEMLINGVNLKYQRQLEDGDFWRTYLGQAYERMSVYRYKALPETGESIDHFGCFFKVQYRKANIVTILRYILVLTIISIAINLISSYLYDFIVRVNSDI